MSNAYTLSCCFVNHFLKSFFVAVTIAEVEQYNELCVFVNTSFYGFQAIFDFEVVLALASDNLSSCKGFVNYILVIVGFHHNHIAPRYLVVELTKVCGEQYFLARRTFYYERIAQCIMWYFKALYLEFAY